MSKEKQIEEMANLVCEMALKPNSCRECAGRKGGCFTIPKMKELYAAGYRKQSEGEWVNGRYNDWNDNRYEEQCSVCGRYSTEYGHPFCPHCGAKMKGGE